MVAGQNRSRTTLPRPKTPAGSRLLTAATAALRLFPVACGYLGAATSWLTLFPTRSGGLVYRFASQAVRKMPVAEAIPYDMLAEHMIHLMRIDGAMNARNDVEVRYGGRTIRDSNQLY